MTEIVMKDVRKEGRPPEWPALFFAPAELACKGDFSLIVDVHALKMLDRLRALVGRPLYITSGYRSPWYNRKVGGAEKSFHMRGMAFDIAYNAPKGELVELVDTAIRNDLFTGFGFYSGFVHMDIGPERMWVG